MHLCNMTMNLNITTRLPMLDEYQGHRLLQQIELDKRQFKVQQSIEQVSKVEQWRAIDKKVKI